MATKRKPEKEWLIVAVGPPANYGEPASINWERDRLDEPVPESQFNWSRHVERKRKTA